MAEEKQPEWVATRAICEHLGISPKHLYRLRDDGLLKIKIHWKDVRRPQGAKPTYRWHLKRCEQALDTPAEKR